MSYILDALKKAESERERGQVPGLNAAPLDYGSRIAYGEGFAPLLRWLVALGVLLALAYGGWRQVQALGSGTPDAGPTTAVAPPLAATGQAPPASQTAALAATQGIAAATAPASSAQTGAAIPPTVAATVTANPLAPPASTVVHVRARVAPLPPEPVIAMDAPDTAPAEVAPKPAAPPPRTAAGTVPLLQDLPDSLRRQIPALNISGSIYSDSPAEWTLIVNDQVLAKGGQVAPELRLEEIGPSSAVFNFRGQRFRMER